jgi:F420-non-reducing hydrogenase iron-sulfur subunit
VQDKDFRPKILAFLCNWCSYAGADLAGISRLQYPPTIRSVRVMCSARVDPLFVIKPLLRGIDGVLIGGCHPGECHYLEGNYYTRRRITMLKKLLEVVGIEHNRVRLEWVSASEGPKFADTVRNFTETIRKLGPNPLREK